MKFMAWHYKSIDNDHYSSLLLHASSKIYEARELFRFFKSILEIRRICLIWNKKYDTFSSVINIVSWICYFFRWIFDNAYILSKIGFLSWKLLIPLSIASRVLWLIALLFYMTYCIITIKKTYNDESDLKVAAIEWTVATMRENLRKIGILRKDYILNLIWTICDTIICMNELMLPKIVLGLNFNDGIEGIAGLVSAIIFLKCIR